MENIFISERVKNALENNIPVVALETTIISHGMPFPKNLEVAFNVEKLIEDNGCVPATIGIVDGVCVIGLSRQQLTEFGKRKDIVKTSRRDLPYVISEKKWGACTVAGTMILASKVGIEVFVTGGIGGVHRDINDTLDISADLEELANTNVTVVCAGVKAILDISKTLEYLETKGVPVIGYKSDEMAAFYSYSSGIKLEYSYQNIESIGNFIKTKRNLGLNGGVLISNPIPKNSEIPNNEINQYINEALLSAKENNISGKRITPYLLQHITNLTNSKSLEANIELIYNNAIVGSNLAKAISKK